MVNACLRSRKRRFHYTFIRPAIWSRAKGQTTCSCYQQLPIQQSDRTSNCLSYYKFTNRYIPFHLPVPSTSTLTGFVMAEQVKSVDYNARKAKFVEKAPTQFIEDAVAVVAACIQ